MKRVTASSRREALMVSDMFIMWKNIGHLKCYVLNQTNNPVLLLIQLKFKVPLFGFYG